MVTGMNRLQAALAGRAADRVPVFCNLLDQGARELGLSLRDYYARGRHVAEGQLRMREKYGYDNVWSLFYVGKEAELFGCRKIIYAEDGPPNVEHFVIEQWADVARLAVPTDVAAHPAFEGPAECLALLKREAGGKHPICAYVTSTMTLPALLMGLEKWMELLLIGPASVRDELLAKCHEFFVKEIAAYRNAGADVLVYSNPFGSTDTVPRKWLLEHALPWIEKDIRAVGPAGLVFYCGMSRMGDVLDIVRERTGLGVYYLSPMDDISAAKRLLDGHALTCGVLNDIKLIGWTREEIRAEVKRIMHAGQPGGRFLFGTGVMPMAIPEANIRAMLDFAYEYGSQVG